MGGLQKKRIKLNKVEPEINNISLKLNRIFKMFEIGSHFMKENRSAGYLYLKYNNINKKYKFVRFIEQSCTFK